MVVIGGGAIGLAVAWRAARRAARSCCSRARRAARRPGLARRRRHARARHRPTFGERSPRWLSASPARRAGRLSPSSCTRPRAYMTTGLRPCGTLVVARDRDEAEALEREIAFRREHGLRVERLRGSQARRLEPALAPTVRLGLLAPEDHAVDPRRLTAALATACARVGVRVRELARVAEVLVRDDAVTGVRLAGGDGEVIESDTLVVAAGSWSGGLRGCPRRRACRCGRSRDRSLRLRDPRGSRSARARPAHGHRQRSGYIVPRGDGRYVLGATVEDARLRHRRSPPAPSASCCPRRRR